MNEINIKSFSLKEIIQMININPIMAYNDIKNSSIINIFNNNSDESQWFVRYSSTMIKMISDNISYYSIIINIVPDNFICFFTLTFNKKNTIYNILLLKSINNFYICKSSDGENDKLNISLIKKFNNFSEILEFFKLKLYDQFNL